MSQIHLLTPESQGGCSAKIDPLALSRLLEGLPLPSSPEVLVGLSTHDDAGVYRLNEETALIVTTDFFPPVVDDPYTFGRIAATNALSDVYAMGGRPLLSLNLMHYPAEALPLEGLAEILQGGQEAVNEAGAFTMGGHTIDDPRVQYGLAVVGTVHPDRVVSNAGARQGQRLVLTKPLGVGVLIAAERVGMAEPAQYEAAVASMCRLNKYAAEAMLLHGVTGATDVTGFGLVGHGLEMAEASRVTLEIETARLPLIPGAIDFVDEGCIPGAVFRNLRYVGDKLRSLCPLNYTYIAADPQTSGGLLMAVDSDKVDSLLLALRSKGDVAACEIGRVVPFEEGSPYLLLR